MNDKAKIIYNAIEDIRETLGAECANISELPDMVRTLANDPSKNGFTTAFIFSSEANPNLPDASVLNVSTGLIEDLGNHWSQTGTNSVSTYRMRNTPMQNTTWMSFAVFNASGERITDWSVPMNLKGAQGPQGLQGVKGDAGEPGEKGEPGLDGVVYRTAMIYTTTDTIDQPLRPHGGFWNRETNDITDILSDDGCVWVTSSDLVEKKTYRWISEATFEQSGYIKGEWSTPFRITGEDGQDGKDGLTIEFVYRLLPSIEAYDSLREYLSEYPLYSSSESDKIPSTNDSVSSSKWTDSPIGISSEWPIEVVSSRNWDESNKRWGNWSNCIIWSKWGEDGQDGDGVEYIYLVTPKTDGEFDITSNYVRDRFMPYLDALMNHPNYQDDEFCINGDFTVEGFDLDGYDWTDEPSDIGPNEPIEWVSVRKKTTTNNKTSWGKYSDPTLWATYSEDGASYLTSYVFSRSTNTPVRPKGGDYFNPKPTNGDGIWFDSVPSGTEPVWMSVRTFCSDSNNEIDKGWSDPKILSDSPNFQVEYSANKEIKREFLSSLENFKSYDDPVAAWREDQARDGLRYIWGDDDTIVDPIWMITSTYSGGMWSDWVLTRIKGEKGEKGESGTSVSIRFKCQTLDELLAEWRDYTDGLAFFDTNNLTVGDGVFVDEEGFLYVYSGGYYAGEEKDFDVYWTSVEIAGEPGKSAYLYVAYADIDPTTNEYAVIYPKEQGPKKYIGFWSHDVFLADGHEELKKASNYTWQRWRGEDGWGQEQIFILTNSIYDPNGNHPPLPLRTTNNDDKVRGYLPSSDNIEGAATATWQDSPQTVTEKYPYCWVASRRVSETEFNDWTGVKGDTVAALYSRYSYDGASAINVRLTNDLAVIPMQDGEVDPDFLDETITTVVQAFSGDESVDAEHIKISVGNDLARVDDTTVTLNLSKITSDTTDIPIKVTLYGSDTEHIVTWKIMVTDVVYEIEPSIHNLRRYTNGEYAGMLDQTAMVAQIRKWCDNKWQDANVPLFAQVMDIQNKEIRILSENDGTIKSDLNGRKTINLEGLMDVSRINLYIVPKEGWMTGQGSWISWEEIGVNADGLNGGKLEVDLYPDQVNIPLEGEAVDPEFVALHDATNPINTYVTIRKEGQVVPASQVTMSLLSEEDYEKFEILTDAYGYQTGSIVVKNPADLYGFKELPIKVTPKWDITDSRTVVWRFTNTNNAYYFKFGSSVIKRDPYKHTLIDPTVIVDIKMWDGSSYSTILSKTLFVKISYSGDTEPETLLIFPGESNYVVDFGNRKNISSLTFYVTSDNTEGGERLKEELINVSADGQNVSYVTLTPDWVQIPVENGHVDPDYFGKTFESKLTVTHGTTELSENNYTVTIGSDSGWEYKDGKISFTVTEDNYTKLDSVYIKVDIPDYNSSVEKFLKVELTEHAYRIKLDYDPIKLNDLLVPKDLVSGTVEKWDGFEYTPHPMKLILREIGTISGRNILNLENESDEEGNFSFNITDESLFKNGEDKIVPSSGFVLEGYNTDNEVVFSEPINVVEGTITADEKETVMTAIITSANENVTNALSDVTTSITGLETDLKELVSDVGGGSEDEIAAAAAALADAVKTKSALEKLQQLIKNAGSENGTVPEGSVLTTEDLWNLSRAALGADLQEAVGKDDIANTKAWITNLNAVTGKFFSVDAENLSGTLIKGKTIQSTTLISNSTDPTWKINNEGAGYFANKNIEWNKDGKCHFDGSLYSTEASLGTGQNVYSQGAINNTTTKFPLSVDNSGNITLNSFETDPGNTNLKRIANTIEVGTKGILISSTATGTPATVSGGNAPITTNTVSGTMSTAIKINSSLGLNSGYTQMSPSSKVYSANHKIDLGAFNVSGSGTLTMTGKISTGTGLYYTSDETLKDFTEDVYVDFDKLKTIPKKYFNWKDGGDLQIGTSAQEVQKLYPEIVTETDNKLTVDYAKLSVIALAAVDKLYEELTSIKKELSTLKSDTYGNRY